MKLSVKGPQSSRRRRLLFVGGALLALLALASIYLVLQRDSNDNNPPPETSSNSQPSPLVVPKIQFAAMGDMIPHDTITAGARTDGGYDYGRYFQHIKSLYADADVVFCNQEGPSAGARYGISGYPSFNAPPEFAKGLQASGCSLINLANNHMADKGVNALGDTVKLWQDLKPLGVAGANRTPEEQLQVAYFSISGIKVAFLAFADFNNVRSTPAHAVNLYHDEAMVRKLATEARANSDVVIVSMHWGSEDLPSINSDQKQQTELLASLGVDVIIGAGPHVLQPVETITRPDGQPMLVWYSLGNMLSSQLNIPQLFSGVALFDITKEKDGIRIDNVRFAPTYMHYDWSAADRAAGNLGARQNPMIYPLSQAAEPLSRSHFGTTIEAQRAYITDILGPDVVVK